MTDRPQGLIPGSGRKGRPKVLDQMASLRFPTPLLDQARKSAQDNGESLSDLVRVAVAAELRRRGRQRAA